MAVTAVWQKFNAFETHKHSGVHQMQTGTSHVFRVFLTNTAPLPATHSVYADLSGGEPATANGYTVGGISIGTITGATNSSGVFNFKGTVDPTWDATGTWATAFRYAVLYNSTPTSPLKPLIAFWDQGSPVTLTNGQSFTVDLNQIDGMYTSS